MLHTPFYDPTKSYEENYEQGPYGAFAASNAADADGKKYEQASEPTFDYLGHKVFLPFGIPAGPLLNSNFVKAAFEKGFDICVYKTVRSDIFPCHPFPNVLAVDINEDLTLERMKQPVVADTNYKEPLSITNSFGVPSKKPEAWQADVKKAIASIGKGQVMILSFMGTARENQTQQEFVNDFALAAKLAYETGAPILEIDISCPNIGNEGLVCYDLDTSEKVCAAVRAAIGNTPLALKIGYFEHDEQLEGFAKIAAKYAQDIAAINTLGATIVDKTGKQALPGSSVRLKGGVCGHAIKWAGLDMVKRLVKIRKKISASFTITGVGGVTIAQDYVDYKTAGADVVMSATGAMWNPYLAADIKKKNSSNHV